MELKTFEILINSFNIGWWCSITLMRRLLVPQVDKPV